jgi:hypothetical protein
MYNLGFCFLFCPAGWPVSRDLLLLNAMPIQAHYFDLNQLFFTAGAGPWGLGWGLLGHQW